MGPPLPRMISLGLLITFLALCQAQQNYDMCYKTANPLGSCTCNEQFFVNDDCTTGFLCRDDINQENPANDGCLIQCNEGWQLLADPRNGGHWYCTNISTPICPGKFNTECPCNDCPIGDCQCDGQLRVSQDCKTAHYCNSTLPNGFDEITCSNPNEIVYVNLAQMSWSCAADDGRCPGAFHVGCETTTTTTTTTNPTTTNNNPTTTTTSLAGGLTALNSLLALGTLL